MYFDEDEDDLLATLAKRSFAVRTYLGQHAGVSAQVDVLGLGDFDYVPRTARALLRQRRGSWRLVDTAAGPSSRQLAPARMRVPGCANRAP